MEQPNEVGTKEDLARYRLEVAGQDISSAKLLMDSGDFRGANNRAYYAIFHALNAIHALDEKSYKKHKDAIANFNKDYVKTAVFDRSIGKKVSQAEEIRHASDYNDFYVATKNESQRQIDYAEEILRIVADYCEERMKK